MKRIVLWSLSTLTVLVLLLGYHTSTSGVPSASAPTAIVSGSTAGSSSSSSSSTVTGDAADTRYGPVQVEITVEDGKVTDVSVPVYPASDPRDAEINQYAVPVLVQETLDAQSSSIDMVSGATYTSEGYVQSLQSALDQAGL